MKIQSLTGLPRRFNNKVYKLESSYTTKAEAGGRSAKLKQQGYRVRVHRVKIQGVQVYEVYKR